MRHDEIRTEILEDVKRFTKECLEEEICWKGHLRWIILKRLILQVINPKTQQQIKDFSKNDLKLIISEMENNKRLFLTKTSVVITLIITFNKRLSRLINQLAVELIFP